MFWRDRVLKIFILSKEKIKNIGVVCLIVCIAVLFKLSGGYKLIDVFLNSKADLPIYSVETKEKRVALTFDIGWGDEYIPSILKVLDDNNVKATFFILGTWVDKYPNRVKEIDTKGHEIGNHSNNHIYFTRLTKSKIKEEVFTASSKIKKITGKETKLMRVPYGDYNSEVIKAIEETGHYCIQWDVDPIDWRTISHQQIEKTVISKTRNGSIILLHNSSMETVKALDTIIKELKNKGYEFVKVSDLIYKDNYYIDFTGRQKPLNE